MAIFIKDRHHLPLHSLHFHRFWEALQPSVAVITPPAYLKFPHLSCARHRIFVPVAQRYRPHKRLSFLTRLPLNLCRRIRVATACRPRLHPLLHPPARPTGYLI